MDNLRGPRPWRGRFGVVVWVSRKIDHVNKFTTRRITLLFAGGKACIASIKAALAVPADFLP